ncbi:MAG: hypothetical protein Q8O87_00555 [bacterium]|nr:hypothetical protein [bacterium]
MPKTVLRLVRFIRGVGIGTTIGIIFFGIFWFINWITNPEQAKPLIVFGWPALPVLIVGVVVWLTASIMLSHVEDKR